MRVVKLITGFSGKQLTGKITTLCLVMMGQGAGKVLDLPQFGFSQ